MTARSLHWLRSAWRSATPLHALLILIVVAWPMSPPTFIAEDCFFYLVVARNLALDGVQTFSGLTGANGFHPLWLYLLSAYTWLVHSIWPEAIRWAGYATPLSAAVLLGATQSLLLIARRLRVSAPIAAGIPVVFFGCAGVLYSEGHLHLLLLAWLTHATLSSDDARGPARVGVLAALTFLARLDSVFVVAALWLWYVGRVRPDARGLVVASLPPLLLGGAYLVSNQLLFGDPTPVSGWLKSSFPHPIVPRLYLRSANVTSFGGYGVLFGWAPLFAASGIAVVCRRALSGPRRVLLPLLAGTWGHALYTAVLTAGFTSWYWYYVLPVFVFGLALAVGVDHLLYSRSKAVALLAYAALSLVTALLLVRGRHRDEEGISYRTARWVQRNVPPGQTVLVSEWPGNVGYFSDAGVVAADMLTANRDFIRSLLEADDALQQLLAHARQVGKPVRFVIYNGGGFLTHDPAAGTLELHHPRLVENHRIIGRLHVGSPLFEDRGLLVWRLPEGP